MNDLPDLPFENVLSYLSLEDLIRFRGVSKGWYKKISAFKVANLFLSEWKSVRNQHQLVVGAFAQNYIRTSRFEAFFAYFGRSMLSSLAHLRLCDLHLDVKVRAFALADALNSFVQLEKLDLIQISNLGSRFNRLNLPNLRSIHLESLQWIESLTLDTPRLNRIHAWDLQNARLELLHVESVQGAVLDTCALLDVERLKNLQTLFCQVIYLFGDSFLVSLPKLKEVHFNGHLTALEMLHDQKRRHNRADLKIFYRGIRLNSPQDYSKFPDYPVLDKAVVTCVVENYDRVADQLPLYCSVYYSRFEPVVAQVPTGFWRRLTNLKALEIDRTVENVRQFFAFLKCFDDVRSLAFNRPQPQQLFDQLPVHLPSLESLEINYQNPDLAFLFELSCLIDLALDDINAQFVQRIVQELKFLRVIRSYQEDDKELCIKIGKSKQFTLQIGRSSKEILTDFNGLIRVLNFQKWMNSGKAK